MADPTTDARRLRDALEPIAALSFHSPPFLAAYAAVGLVDFFPAYTFGRSSVLGTPDPAVVVAAFGVWEPGLITRHLQTARRTCSLEAVRGASAAGAAAAVGESLAEVPRDEIAAVVAVLRRGIDAADGTARVLFSGCRALAWPDDPHVGLWRAATAWRELRGDSNLAACVAHGVSGLQANVLNELRTGYPLGDYTATRQWSEEQVGGAARALRERGLLDGDALSEAGSALREQIEQETDAAVQPAVDAVGDDLDDVLRRTGAWSQLIVDRGWFPDDEKKRAAG